MVADVAAGELETHPPKHHLVIGVIDSKS